VYDSYFFPVDWIARFSIWFMVVLSLVSAGDYFYAFWSRIDRHVVKRKRRAFILSRRKKRDVAPI
jgi:CDP-diacylglycerol--glycerol-3-phosphate 3-phosphatidyltransferase